MAKPRTIHCYYNKSGKCIYISLGPPPDSPEAINIEVLTFKTAAEAQAEYTRLLTHMATGYAPDITKI